jgi:hypothetical protein
MTCVADMDTILEASRRGARLRWPGIHGQSQKQDVPSVFSVGGWFDLPLLFALNLDLAFGLQPYRKALPDYNPTSFLISARNVSRCATAQASSLGNR